MEQTDTMPTSEKYQIDTEAPTQGAIAAVGAAAEAWGAGWQGAIDGGRLALPTLSGLRREVMAGRVTVEPSGRGSRVRFEVEETTGTINRPAALILLFGALGGLCIVLWPFFPALLGIAPVAVVLAFAAWLLVASRLRQSGPDDFLALVQRFAESEEES